MQIMNVILQMPNLQLWCSCEQR